MFYYLCRTVCGKVLDECWQVEHQSLKYILIRCPNQVPPPCINVFNDKQKKLKWKIGTKLKNVNHKEKEPNASPSSSKSKLQLFNNFN